MIHLTKNNKMAGQSLRLSSTNVQPWKHTLTGKLRECATLFPNREAYVFRQPLSQDRGRLSVTFQELDRKSSVLAAWLLESSIGPGDRVVVQGDNCPGWLYLDYACMKIKAILIRASVALQTPESLLELSKLYRGSALFINPDGNDNLVERLNSFLSISRKDGHTHSDSSYPKYVASLTTETSFELPNLNNILGLSPSESRLQEVHDIISVTKPTDYATTFCTSGSTGQPKVVLHTHQSLGGSRQMLFEKLGFHNGLAKYFVDRNFAWLGSAIHIPVVFGSCNVYVDPKYTMVLKQYDFIFDVIEEEKVSCAIFLPYILHDIGERAKKVPIEALASLHTVMTTGERLSQDVLKAILPIIPNLIMYYGTTECPPIAGWNLYERDLFGEVLDGNDLMVAQEKKVVPIGDIGEIWVRGCLMFDGYMDDPEATANAITPDGWFQTGDMGRMDSRGRIQIMGRKSEVISYATRKIFPIAIETFFKRMPSVEKCVVVGIPDSRFFEEICAFIVPSQSFNVTADDILSYAKEEMLGNPEIGGIPKYVLIGETIPTTSMGKTDRKAIRQMAIDKFLV